MAVCSVCTDSRRSYIDKALSQQSSRAVAEKFGFTSPSSLVRHKNNCIPRELRYLTEERREVRSRIPATKVEKLLTPIKFERPKFEGGPLETPADVLAAARNLHDELQDIMVQAKELGDPKMAVVVVRESLNVLTFFARALKMFDDGIKVDLSTKVVSVLSGLSESDLRSLMVAQ